MGLGAAALAGPAESHEPERKEPAPRRTPAKESEGGGGQSAAGACGRAPLALPVPLGRRVRAAVGSASVGGNRGLRGRLAAAREVVVVLLLLLLLLLWELHPRHRGRQRHQGGR